MRTTFLLPFLLAPTSAEARKRGGTLPVAQKVPSIEDVVRDEGFVPTPSQSETYRPGVVLVPNARGGHDEVHPDCIGVEPTIKIMSQSSIATSLSAGVSARLTAARGQVAVGVEKRLSFVDPEQRTIPFSALSPTEDCSAGLETAARFTDLSHAILVYDVLIAQIQNTVCTKADASGRVMLLGEAEAAAYSECVQESDAQVPLGFKFVPLSQVFTSAVATSPTPALPSPTTGSGGTTGGAFGDVSGIAAQIRQAEELKARLEGELQDCLQAEAGKVQQSAKRDWATLGQLRDLATTEAGRKAAETQVKKFVALYEGKTVTCWNDLGERSGTVTPREVADARLFLSSPPPGASGKAGIEWVRIPGGTFQMGSNNGRSNEKPVRYVPSFELMKTEVTVGQYRECVEAGSCSEPTAYSSSGWEKSCNWGQSGREDHPINCVDWEQAQDFAAWAGGRLPTEAEWEYAARSGGKAWTYPWGDEKATCSRAVMDDGGNGCGQNRTWPVCSKPAGNSTHGVCDLAGNVWEWVQDGYHDSYSGAPGDGRAWEDGASYRVIRGGGWGNIASYLRAPHRSGSGPPYRYIRLGFRLAR